MLKLFKKSTRKVKQVNPDMIKVLFVCMGNICRSPTAQGAFEKCVDESGLADHVFIDSAGTHAYHVSEPPDHRAQLIAQKRGIDLSKQRARRAVVDDFNDFDFILAMDKSNYHDLLDQCPPEHQDKVHLFLSFAAQADTDEVPDPYYGGHAGFERVFDLVEEASSGLMDHIRKQHSL